MAVPDRDGAAVLVNLPVFNTMNVHVWFSQLSAIFQAERIQSQNARFAYVVEKPPPDIASEVSDLTGKSEKRRINDLFNTLQLDQNKPTQLLRKMKNLLGNIMSEVLPRKLWLDKLPIHTAQILTTLPEDLDLLQVAAIADRIVQARTLNGTHISSADSTPRDDTLKKMQQQINKLSTQLERLSRMRSCPAYNA
ncbi:unnamed protein product [Acanthosepion pharaonis]|uniref:DUF7041 domain-containing protein n=1 Tax=Acanthosepion pharaonis TaxID=158019 RepID=A0A812BUI7_ACAPH|nr:unnamed protein product [Sepia pharaonis]